MATEERKMIHSDSYGTLQYVKGTYFMLTPRKKELPEIVSKLENMIHIAAELMAKPEYAAKRAAEGKGDSEILLNVEKNNIFGSSYIGAIAKLCLKASHEKKMRFSLLNVSKYGKTMLQNSGIQKVIKMYDTVQQYELEKGIIKEPTLNYDFLNDLGDIFK